VVSEWKRQIKALVSEASSSLGMAEMGALVYVVWAHFARNGGEK